MKTKNFFLYLIISISIFLSSCSDDSIDDIVPTKPTTENIDLIARHHSSSTGLIDNPAVYKGMYVDNFNLILGNTTEETNLINYAVTNSINSLTFYGLRNAVSNSSNYSKLASFMSRCSQNGITNRVYVNVYYVGSTNNMDTTYIRNYNNSRTLTSEKITGVNLEWEFWNGATTWSIYDQTMKSYYNWTKTQSPALTNEIYFGWFQNPTDIESTMASEMVKYTDRILLHDYRSAPDVAYMQSRMDYFGQASVAQGKKEKIIVLFSAEPDFMGQYYLTHTFNDSYQTYVSLYNSVTFTGKAGLEVQGWELFTYDYAKQYRP